MRYIIIYLLLCFQSQVSAEPITLQQRYDKAMQKLAQATTQIERFRALDKAAKDSFNVGKIDTARNFANELLTLAPNYKQDWNYGNAIQDGNIVLGRIALKDGKIEEAKRRLLEAGKGPGSPVINSFGPNMSLAKDLLEHGDQKVVLEYFDLCRKFWSDDSGELNKWGAEVQAGKIPNFGANLFY